MHHYAVIGHPVKHSLSPEIHALFAEQTHQAMYYDKIETSVTGFKETVQQFVVAGGKGLSVTVPFKQEAYALVDILDDSAKRCGSVNVIRVEDDGKLSGYNTDGAGLLMDLKKNLKFIVKNKRVLLIGAGGAAQGVLPDLLDECPAKLVVVNRTVEKAEAMIARFQDARLTACSFDTLPGFPSPACGREWHEVPGEGLESFDLVINATSSSLSKIDLPLPDMLFSKQSLSYDMMYSRDEPTAFVKWSLAHGVTHAVDGLGMLVEQAALAFQIWRGVYPETVFKMLSYTQGKRI